MTIAPVTYRQLEQSVALPVQVSLASRSGTCDKIDAFSPLINMGPHPLLAISKKPSFFDSI